MKLHWSNPTVCPILDEVTQWRGQTAELDTDGTCGRKGNVSYGLGNLLNTEFFNIFKKIWNYNITFLSSLSFLQPSIYPFFHPSWDSHHLFSPIVPACIYVFLCIHTYSNDNLWIHRRWLVNVIGGNHLVLGSQLMCSSKWKTTSPALSFS